MGDSIAVLIPCYNEAVTIAKVVDDFKRELPEAVIYVYDNNSKDETAKIAAEHGAIVRHEPRQGKGNVVRSMFRDIDADYTLWSTVMTRIPPRRRVSFWPLFRRARPI